MALPDQAPDPHGTLAWATAIFETVKQAYAALIVPTGLGIAWLVRRRDARRDDAQKREDARQRSEEEAHQRIADQLDRESAERFETMRRENADLRADNLTLRAENSRVIGLARRWFDHAHDMRHEAARLLQILFALLQRAGIEPPPSQMPPLSYDIDEP